MQCQPEKERTTCRGHRGDSHRASSPTSSACQHRGTRARSPTWTKLRRRAFRRAIHRRGRACASAHREISCGAWTTSIAMTPMHGAHPTPVDSLCARARFKAGSRVPMLTVAVARSARRRPGESIDSHGASAARFVVSALAFPGRRHG